MGNTATKEIDSTRRSRGLSTSSTTISANVQIPFVQPSAIAKRIRKDKEKQKQREDHAWNLVVRYEENVDGGYLAPFGTYKSNLDYNTEIVRNLIVERKLAPFFTPLEDFDESWSDDELLSVLNSLGLHAKPNMENDEEDEEEDMENHKIRRSTHSIRKQENKKSKEKIRQKQLKWQFEAESRYQRDKLVIGGKKSPLLPSKDLLLKLYREAQECPICFVYYPPMLNISRCCIQPICTECFVQIKRLDPHPPHDEEGNETDTENPEALISETAKCPFCAMSDFGVTYYPPNFKTGIQGTYPAHYKNNDTTVINEDPEQQIFEVTGSPSSPSISNAINKTRSAMGTPPKTGNNNNNTLLQVPSGSTSTSSFTTIDENGERVRRKRQGSIPPTGPGVITTDFIRPDWENKLKNARLKLARRSAAASAIHATSLLYDHPDQSNSSVQTNGNGNGNSSGNRRSNNGPDMRRTRSDTLELEERMIEEAMRLSLLEQTNDESSPKKQK